MTLTDWLAAMTGCDADVAAFSDWLAENGPDDDLDAVRELPAMAERVRRLVAGPANYVYFRLPSPGDVLRAGLAVTFFGGRRYVVWEDERAAGLIAHGAYWGVKSPHFPLTAWVQSACGVALVSTRMEADGMLVVRYKRRD